jgi:hypothetical protein
MRKLFFILIITFLMITVAFGDSGEPSKIALSLTSVFTLLGGVVVFVLQRFGLIPKGTKMGPFTDTKRLDAAVENIIGSIVGKPHPFIDYTGDIVASILVDFDGGINELTTLMIQTISAKFVNTTNSNVAKITGINPELIKTDTDRQYVGMKLMTNSAISTKVLNDAKFKLTV